jgi:hypothetical protein
VLPVLCVFAHRVERERERHQMVQLFSASPLSHTHTHLPSQLSQGVADSLRQQLLYAQGQLGYTRAAHTAELLRAQVGDQTHTRAHTKHTQTLPTHAAHAPTHTHPHALPLTLFPRAGTQGVADIRGQQLEETRAQLRDTRARHSDALTQISDGRAGGDPTKPRLGDTTPPY